MSLRAITWAFDQHDLTPTQRLVLLAMADTANNEHETWNSVPTLERKTGFGKSTIYRERTALCDEEKMVKLEAKDRYRLAVDGLNPPSENDDSADSQSGKKEPSDSQSEKLFPTPGNALDKGTVKNPDGAEADERSDEQKLYDIYLTEVKQQPAGQEIPPSLARTATKALAEYPLKELATAVTGFKAWRKKKPGDVRFSSIFSSHPGGRPLHDHIGFWITCAGDSSPLDGISSEERVRILRAVREVQRAFGSEDSETLAIGAEAMEYLKGRGIEPEPRAGDGYPIFPQLGAST